MQQRRSLFDHLISAGGHAVLATVYRPKKTANWVQLLGWLDLLWGTTLSR
jgi:hypothetical protein